MKEGEDRCFSWRKSEIEEKKKFRLKEVRGEEEMRREQEDRR